MTEEEQTVFTSCVGGWLYADLYLEIARTQEGEAQLRIKDRDMKTIVILGEFNRFIKKVKNLEKLSERASQE